MGVSILMTYEGNLKVNCTHEPSQTTLLTDAPKDNGGEGSAFSPTDLVGTALASCVLTTMAIVANRNGIDLKGMTAKVIKEMVSAPQRRIGSLNIDINMPQNLHLDENMKNKLDKAAYACPVKQSLNIEVQVAININYS